MGKLGRFACIFAPMVLTIASMLCLVLIFTAQLNSKNEIQRSLYFFKAETKDFIADPNKKFPDVPNTELDNKLLKALQGAATKKDLKDFYQVGLWNYCEGDVDDKGKETITYCSPRKANFWFDPAEHWGLNNVTAEEIYTKEMKDGIDAYHKVAKWIFTAYVITIILTGAEFIIGIFAIFSRWGSLATTIVSTAQTVFCIAAAGSATGVYAALVGVFHTVLDPYNINSYLGKKMLAVVWLAVAFSVASGFFWLVSICCCSGKSPHKKVVVEKTPYTYERVASPYMGAAASSHGHSPAPVAGHGTSGSAYEPYRHS